MRLDLSDRIEFDTDDLLVCGAAAGLGSLVVAISYFESISWLTGSDNLALGAGILTYCALVPIGVLAFALCVALQKSETLTGKSFAVAIGAPLVATSLAALTFGSFVVAAAPLLIGSTAAVIFLLLGSHRVEQD